MVVLAAAVVTKAGKPLVARSFNDGFSKPRLESILLSFHRIIPQGAQHTTALSSDGTVRYAWTVVDDQLYTVLVTPPSSNILLDISTLSLVSRIVSEILTTVVPHSSGSKEANVLACAFDILSCFDEVVSLGYRERANMSDVRAAAIEMESHEERIQEIIARNKEHEANEERKRRAKQIEMQRREAARRGAAGGYASVPGGASTPMMSTYERHSFSPVVPSATDLSSSVNTPSTLKKPSFKNKGMQLGAKGGTKKQEFLDSIAPQQTQQPIVQQQQQHLPSNVLSESTRSLPSRNSSSSRPENPFTPVPRENVHFLIRENMSLELARDGGLKSLEVKGDLELHVSDASSSKIVVDVSSSTSASSSDIQFKTHPNVDKATWSESKKIALRDRTRGFPVGQALGVLKWRSTVKDETIVPMTLLCWPTPSENGVCNVNIEYELENENMTLQNVVITIPLPEGEQPSILSCNGDSNYEDLMESQGWQVDYLEESRALEWSISKVDSQTKTGTLEFEVACLPELGEAGLTDSFYPVRLDFVSKDSVCGIGIQNVNDAATAANAVEFSSERVMNADYTVQ